MDQYRGKELMDSYIDLLEQQMKNLFIFYWKIYITSLWLWWWTPTVMTEQQTIRLFNIIDKYFIRNPKYISTIEWHPNSLSKSKIDILSQFWISMISIPLQTLNENSLKMNNRYSSSYIYQAQEMINYSIRKKFTEVSSDMIVWLEWTNLKYDIKTFNFLMNLWVDCIVIFPYQLSTKNHRFSNTEFIKFNKNIEERINSLLLYIRRYTVYNIFNHAKYCNAIYVTKNLYLGDKKYHTFYYRSKKSLIWLGAYALWHTYKKNYYNCDLEDYVNNKGKYKLYKLSDNEDILYYILMNFDNYWFINTKVCNEIFSVDIFKAFKTLSYLLSKEVIYLKWNYIYLNDSMSRDKIFLYFLKMIKIEFPNLYCQYGINNI